MSLRARLIAGLLALATVGLLALAGITYVEQRAFLEQRVDDQARAAVPAVNHALEERGVNVPGSPDARRGEHGPGGRPPGEQGRRGPGSPPVDLPPGTYGERRDGAGRVLGHVVVSYGQQAPPAPRLPAVVPPGELLTVPSARPGGPRYRVLAAASLDQPGVTVVAVPLREIDQTLRRLLAVEALVIGAVLVALAAAASWMVRLGLRPLDRIGETAGAIAGGDLSRRVSPATERTEVGRLSMALNAMLARLEQAFAERQASEDRLRRFLADASHELRTPLASIRGYAEALRMGAASDAADAARARTRIEQEAARMGVLVDDLLTLARLDEVRESIRERVDMAEIARDAVDDARVAAPERSIELRAASDQPVSGDPHQLRQVLGNLVRNALVHTPPDAPIEVSVERDDDEVRIEVRDRGPGLPSADGQALFERFWRADPGRVRGRAGAGLGLAIVAGVVAAHGGRVEARDADGGGASFVVWLPAERRPTRETVADEGTPARSATTPAGAPKRPAARRQ